ncbi:MAG: RagB/SusD family nutrient uptake outer membrane protein [Prevotella sp.]|jgi:hypothetical protein
MSKKNILLAIAMVLLTITSCQDSFLDQTATTDLNEDRVFSDSTYTAGFLTQIYANIGFDVDINRFDPGGLQVACDEAEPRQQSNVSTGLAFATGTVNPTTVSNDVWSICYTNIRRCNKFMSKIDGAPMGVNIKRQYKDEARFLRAWYYYILLRHYGGIPLIGDTCYKATDNIKAKRDTYEKCVNYIVDECNAILDNGALLPRCSGRSNGRISAAACYALIMRVRLDAASPLHNGSGFGTDSTKTLLGYPTYDKERWKMAYDAARATMTMKGDYRLFVYDYCYDFPEAGDEKGWGFYAVQVAGEYATKCTSWNGVDYPYGPYQEIILQHKLPLSTETNRHLGPPSTGGNGSGGYAYADIADAFPMIDGKPIGQSKYTYNALVPARNRDPRFANTIVYNGLSLYNQGNFKPIYTYQGLEETQDAIYSGTPTGYYTRKMMSRGASANWWIEPIQSHPLIRFAEVMLSYAECCNEYYGPDFTEDLGNGTLGGPYEMLKLIRSRAGIEPGDDNMYGLKSNMTQEEMRKAIQDERRIELAFEGFRFFDERRWMIAEETENKTMHGLEVTRSKTGFTAKTIPVRKHVFRKAEYFWPLPYAEIVKIPELIQNPYYD